MPKTISETSATKSTRASKQNAKAEELDRDGVVAPNRSLEQRMEALRLANSVRTERATLKRDLKGGRVRIEQLLANPPECIHSAKVADIMLAVPRYGRVKVTRVLQRCRISPSKTVAGLSERQRQELIVALTRP